MRQSDAELFGVETSSGEESPLGIFDLVDFADYLALDAVNNSRLKHAAKSLKHYRHAVENPQPIKSDALRFGSLVHHRKLEPESFRERYHVIPDFSDQVADMKGNRPKKKTVAEVEADGKDKKGKKKKKEKEEPDKEPKEKEHDQEIFLCHNNNDGMIEDFKFTTKSWKDS